MKNFLIVALCIQATTAMMASEGSTTQKEYHAKTKVLVTRFMELEDWVTIKKYRCPLNNSTIERYLNAYQELSAHFKLKKNRPNKRQRERNVRRSWTYDMIKADYERPVQFKKFPFSDGLFE